MSPVQSTRRRWRLVGVGLLALFVWALPLADAYWFGHYAPYYGDTRPAELLPVSIVKYHDLRAERFYHHSPIEYWFTDNPRTGRVTSIYPVVPALLNVPATAIAQHRGIDIEAEGNVTASRWTTTIVATLAVPLVFLTLIAFMSLWSAAVFALIFYFGTAAWSVGSTELWQHGPSLLFVSAASALLVRPRSWLFALGGFFLGMAVWNRPVDVAMLVPLAIYGVAVARSRKSAAWFIVCGCVPVLLMCVYSHVVLGSIRDLGQGQGASGFTGQWTQGAAGMTFSPNRGIFIYSPMFLFVLPMLFSTLLPLRWWRRHRRMKRNGDAPVEAVTSTTVELTTLPTTPTKTGREFPALYACCALGVLMLFCVVAKWGMWWGGHSFGYRLLTDMCVPLIILLAAAWQQWIRRRWWLIGLFTLSVVASCYVHWLGARLYPRENWNPTPVNIDAQPNRAWNWHSTQIARLHQLMWNPPK